jgi:glycosyltransferase involved in cell wall biosynthesis
LFGNVRRYKGIEDLLEAFEKLSKNKENIKLILAGECGEPSLLKDIKDYEKVLKNKLISHVRHIEDKDIQHYFNSANIAVFPFKKVTTSSSVLLALAYSKPIIIPGMGCLNDIPKNTGFFYSSKKKALYNAMKRAIKRKRDLNSLGKNAEIYSRSLSWDKIAEKKYNLYESIL